MIEIPGSIKQCRHMGCDLGQSGRPRKGRRIECMRRDGGCVVYEDSCGPDRCEHYDAEINYPIFVDGKERSGTTWLRHLITRNTRYNGVSGLGRFRKHVIYGERISPTFPVVVIHKHPLAWLPSFWKFIQTEMNPQRGRRARVRIKNDVHHSEFRDWVSCRVRKPLEYECADPIGDWLAFHSQWMESATRNRECGAIRPVQFVKYDDLLADPQAELARIIPINHRPGTFDPVRNRALHTGEVGRDEFDPRPHATQKYMDAYDAETLAMVRDRLATEGADVMGALGYEWDAL